MIKKEILLSIIFLILSYFLLSEKNFLNFKSGSDLFYFALLLVAAFFLVVTSRIELNKYKEKPPVENLISLICLCSSLLFLISGIFSLITLHL